MVVTSILAYIADLTGTRRRKWKEVGASKSPEQIKFETLLCTPTVSKKNEPTPEEVEANFKVKQTTPMPIGEALKDKDYVLLYYSASWCPPCRNFTPHLADFATANSGNSGKTFQVVLVSWDNTMKTFANYFKKMPQDWVAIPPSSSRAIQNLNTKHGIRGIPAIVVIDTKTNKIVSTVGRDWVERDPYARVFPWDAESIEQNSGFFGSIGLGKWWAGTGIASSSSSSQQITGEHVARAALTVGGGLCGLFVYRNMRSRAAWLGFKERLADRLNAAAKNGSH